jgi:hypothetical protein
MAANEGKTDSFSIILKQLQKAQTDSFFVTIPSFSALTDVFSVVRCIQKAGKDVIFKLLLVKGDIVRNEKIQKQACVIDMNGYAIGASEIFD